MKFAFDYDSARNRINVTIRELWTVDVLRDFAVHAGSFAQEIRAIRADYDILIDSRDFPVQSNDVADLLPSVTQAGLSLTSGRAASIVGSHLNKLQAERTQTHPRIRIFMTAADAEAWLAEPHHTSLENPIQS